MGTIHLSEEEKSIGYLEIIILSEDDEKRYSQLFLLAPRHLDIKGISYLDENTLVSSDDDETSLITEIIHLSDEDHITM
jgi:hypothetical protein